MKLLLSEQLVLFSEETPGGRVGQDDIILIVLIFDCFVIAVLLLIWVLSLIPVFRLSSVIVSESGEFTQEEALDAARIAEISWLSEGGL